MPFSFPEAYPVFAVWPDRQTEKIFLDAKGEIIRWFQSASA